MNTTSSAHDIAADLLDSLQRGTVRSAGDFFEMLSKRVHPLRRTQVVDALFERGLAHITSPTADQVTDILLDWDAPDATQLGVDAAQPQ